MACVTGVIHMYVRSIVLAVLAVALVLPANSAGAVPNIGDPVVRIYFDPKKSNLDLGDRATLDAVIPQLDGVQTIRVDGFVQSAKKGTGVRRYLSRDRARAVAKYLQRAFQKRGWNIDVSYVGKGRPRQNADSPFARRAEVIVTSVN
jgi:outer membrane protein OmpA-like peptidoglycan-associated protein